MSDFISIKEAMTQGKGNFRFIVVSLGKLKSGTTKTGNEWQKQIAVIKDESGAINLTLWNNDIGKIIDGKSYTLENAYWTEYNGEPQVSLGKFHKLHEISGLNSSTETVDTPPAYGSTSTHVQEEFVVTQNEMIVRIYDMTKEMYHDFIDGKSK